MYINRMVITGSLESNDTLITLKPGRGIEIAVDSIVKRQFGDRIEETAREILDIFGIGDAHIHIQDRGALDCTLRARLETAIRRAKGDNR